MTDFTYKFGQRIKAFWDDLTEHEKSKLLGDLLEYANGNPQKFKNEIKKVLFDKEVDPLPVILEALSKDTENWGDFFVEVLEEILKAATNANKPSEVLTYLAEYAYIEKDQKPFVQKIVNLLNKALDADHSVVVRAAIWHLPSFLDNSSIRNKVEITQTLHQKLNDKNWKTRYIAYDALKFENLLPDGYTLRPTDKFRVMIFGKPYDFI